MPEESQPKPYPHPLHATNAGEVAGQRFSPIPYAELQVTSNFTFLTGASHPGELVAYAAHLGHTAIAVTDRNTLAGIVRAHIEAKRLGVRLIVGCRVELVDPEGLSILVYPTDMLSYSHLCQLLTLGKRRAEKGQCHLALTDLLEHAEGLIAVAVPSKAADDTFATTLHNLREAFNDDRLSLAAHFPYAQGDAHRLECSAALARAARIPLVATNDVLYHAPDRRPLQDVLTCIREGTTIDRAGFLLAANAERHLKPPEEMARLFRGFPAAIARTVEIAERTAPFSLDQLRYQYPDEVVPAGATPMSHLAALARAGAAERYPAGVPDKVRALVERELRLIDELNYAPYFLTVHDLVRFARSKGILCQGRGAAANSAVCYCLGVTAVDPDRVEMLFERFISKERDEPPDIDIDFEHERREEVIQYIYAKYGRDRAALTAEAICYRSRLAIRDVGKAMGLSMDRVDRLAKELDWWDDDPDLPARVRALGLDPSDPRLSLVLALSRQLVGFPRHLSQHVGGFVITRSPLSGLVPIENAAMQDRTVIEWDKDDIEALGMLKVDCLGLGMLTCIRKCLEMVNGKWQSGGVAEWQSERTGAQEKRNADPQVPRPDVAAESPSALSPHSATPSLRHFATPPLRHSATSSPPLSLHSIPPEDPATYDMICNADTVGVFQIESRAQMSMLPRLRPRCYYDLVIEVAIVRPGPIQGKMVHPYLRRRTGEEPVRYASPEIERVLGRTLGVPLFQEQAMALAIVAAGFTPGEADQLRRAMAAWKRSGSAILAFERKLIDGMLQRGYSREFAAQVFQQVSGFSGYGFPESHAASFALLVYSSSWLKRHHPAAFAAALINSQPMGFYQPAQIVRDAQAHGVEVRPVDVNASRWDCTLEPTPSGPALRLGMRLVSGMPEAEAHQIAQAVEARGPFTSVDALWRASRVRAATLRRLAAADAFASMNLTRQRAVWSVQALKDGDAPLFDGLASPEPRAAQPALPAVSPESEVSSDYNTVGLSLKSHPIAFVREALNAKGITPNADLADESRCPAGRRITVAGLVLLRQRPSTASGIVFMTIEDETGTANLIVRPQVYERYRRVARHSRAIVCAGTVERAGQVVHVLVKSMRRLEPAAGPIALKSRDFH